MHKIYQSRPDDARPIPIDAQNLTRRCTNRPFEVRPEYGYIQTIPIQFISEKRLLKRPKWVIIQGLAGIIVLRASNSPLFIHRNKPELKSQTIFPGPII